MTSNNLPSVFIRGVGAVTPLDENWNSSYQQLLKGKTAIDQIKRFDTKHFRCTVAAEIPTSILDTLPKHPDVRISLVEKACDEALANASLPENPGKLGIFIGAESGRARFETIVSLAKTSGLEPEFNHHLFFQNAEAFAEQIQFAGVSPAAVASFLAKKYRAQGPNRTISLACSSSAVAITEAVRAVQQGQCDWAICGGVGADVDPLMITGFGQIRALSANGRSCPFDSRRDGFVVGEGSAILILTKEPDEHAIEIAGFGRSLDAFNITAPDPKGLGAERAMRKALEMAQINFVDYIQAHGTSTPLNDEVEALAIQRVFGERTMEIPVSSVKGALGHWIAGAGALGTLCAYSAMTTKQITATAGLTHSDPRCPINVVKDSAISKNLKSTLINSFAFGGANCSIILRQQK